MRVAFATSAGAIVDGNFRKCKSFSVWDIGPHEAHYVTSVNIKAESLNEDDRIAARAKALNGCAIVCATQINGPASAKLVARNIHPMKTGDGIVIERIIDKLQNVLLGSPPPWIRKAQIKDVHANNIDYDRDDHVVDHHSDSILDVTLADILGRYPELSGLLLGSGLALFTNEQDLATLDVLMPVREALGVRGICLELFQMLLEKAITERQRFYAAPYSIRPATVS